MARRDLDETIKRLERRGFVYNLAMMCWERGDEVVTDRALYFGCRHPGGRETQAQGKVKLDKARANARLA